MRRFSSIILSSVSLAALAASPAYAQVTGAPADSTPEKTAEGESLPPAAEEPTNAEGEPVSEGEIVVTGSRLRRDNFNTPSPVTVVTRDDQVLAGATSTAETLQSSTITSGTSQISGAFLGFVSEGGPAAATVGLRGLGSQRTLILLNGRRLAPAGAGSELVAADLNVLPTAMVQRIEVLREGASAIYGSDAIAGVINVITDTKVDGITADLYTDMPLHLVGSAGRTYRASLTAGKTFDRGHITGSLEYRQSNGVRQNDNPDWRCPRALLRQNGQEIGQQDPTTGDFRCFQYLVGGGSGIATGYGIYGIALDAGDFGVGQAGIYNFGRVTFPGYITGDFDLTGDPVAVNGLNARPTLGVNNAQLRAHVISPVKTYTGYVNGAYELGVLGDAELYGEALFTRRKSAQDSAVQINLDIAVLDTDVIQIYGGNQSYLGPGYNPNRPPLANLPAYAGQQSPFYIASWAAYPINRWTPFIMPQQLQVDEQKIDFWRANGGLRGNLGLGDWRYDGNVQVSRTRAKFSVTNPTIERMNNVLVAEVAPAGTPSDLVVTALPGQVGAGIGYTCASNITNGAYNGGDCVPLNFYDPQIVVNGALPDALFNYLYQENRSTTDFNQETFSLIFDGTILNLPAGPVRGAVGFEYRRDEIDDQPSAAAQTAQLYNRASAGRTRGKDNVKEVFGEINVPLLAERPFFHLLEFSGSGRYTDYKSYGSDFVYRLNAQWAPVEALRFRASYGTNFRAPNLYEQFVADQTGFYPGANDPCNGFGTQLPATSQTYQNCLAALTPILDNPATAANEALAYIANSGPQVTTRGGAGILEAETARSWGVGAVITAPRDIIDFSFAVDYFNTLVEDEVRVLNSTILTLCYGASNFGPDNPYCALIAPREQIGEGTAPGSLTSFLNPYLNVSRQTAEGIDFNARYSTPLFGGQLTLQGNATRMLEQGLETFAGSGLFDYNGTLGYPGFGSGPKWTGNLDTRFRTGPWTLRWGMEYVGRASSEIPSLVNPEFGPGNGIGDPNQLVERDLVAEPYYEHGASIQYRWRNVGQITVGVSNIFNEKPPTISDAQDTFGQYFRIGNYFGGGPYNYTGRSVFINLTKTF